MNACLHCLNLSNTSEEMDLNEIELEENKMETEDGDEMEENEDEMEEDDEWKDREEQLHTSPISEFFELSNSDSCDL